MALSVDELIAEIHKLPAEQRDELERKLLGAQVVLTPGEEKEIMRRVRALNEGTVETIPVEQMLAETRHVP